jgi:MYXO-CTERM domain-containing protein
MAGIDEPDVETPENSRATAQGGCSVASGTTDPTFALLMGLFLAGLVYRRHQR